MRPTSDRPARITACATWRRSHIKKRLTDDMPDETLRPITVARSLSTHAIH